MNVKINVNVEQLVPQVLEDGLVLVILKYAKTKNPTEDVIVRLNSVEDLKEKFEVNDTDTTTFEEITSFNELYEVEY